MKTLKEILHKLGTNPYGECECSYEDKQFLKKKDVSTIINNLRV